MVEQEAWSSSETGKGGGWAAAAAERRPFKGASTPGSAAYALAVTVWRAAGGELRACSCA